MTPEQEATAEQLIDRMKQSGGTANWREFRNERSVDANDMMLIIRALKELEIIEPITNDITVARLTEKYGWTFPGFEAQRHLVQTKKAADDERDKYDRLTKRFIYKARLVPYIFSTLSLLGTIASIIISIKALNYKKDQAMTPTAQPLTPTATNTSSLLPVDTLSRTKPK